MRGMQDPHASTWGSHKLGVVWRCGPFYKEYTILEFYIVDWGLLFCKPSTCNHNLRLPSFGPEYLSRGERAVRLARSVTIRSVRKKRVSAHNSKTCFLEMQRSRETKLYGSLNEDAVHVLFATCLESAWNRGGRHEGLS